MHRRKLPIGIQTFAKIRGEDFNYVDKTDFIRQLIDEGSQYFLLRPRIAAMRTNTAQLANPSI